jgi:hypothetical protein
MRRQARFDRRQRTAEAPTSLPNTAWTSTRLYTETRDLARHQDLAARVDGVNQKDLLRQIEPNVRNRGQFLKAGRGLPYVINLDLLTALFLRRSTSTELLNSIEPHARHIY